MRFNISWKRVFRFYRFVNCYSLQILTSSTSTAECYTNVTTIEFKGKSNFLILLKINCLPNPISNRHQICLITRNVSEYVLTTNLQVLRAITVNLRSDMSSKTLYQTIMTRFWDKNDNFAEILKTCSSKTVLKLTGFVG